MQTYYVLRDINAIADVSRAVSEDCYEINRINVPPRYRGCGYGSKLLKLILDDADTEQARLRLGISPSGGLTFTALRAWYKRHGFVRRKDGYYVREPVAQEQRVGA